MTPPICRLSRQVLNLSACDLGGPINRTIKTISPLCNITQSQTNTNNTSTLNQAELNHFRSLSSKWWTGAEFLPLRTMNSLRVPFVAEAFQSQLSPTELNSSNQKHSLKGVKLLDIGSGGGILSEALSRLGANVTGIDPVEENVKAAELHANAMFRNSPKLMPQYKSCTIEELAADSTNLGAFDGIIASEVIEHIDNIAVFLQCAFDCLRPGGFFFITTMNQTTIAYLAAIRAAEDIFGLVPKGTHDFDKFVPPAALKLVLDDFNCDVVQVHGMFFNPLTMQWSWTQNQWINYALMAQKRI